MTSNKKMRRLRDIAAATVKLLLNNRLRRIYIFQRVNFRIPFEERKHIFSYFLARGDFSPIELMRSLMRWRPRPRPLPICV